VVRLILYDWCHRLLTAEEKQAFIKDDPNEDYGRRGYGNDGGQRLPNGRSEARNLDTLLKETGRPQTCQVSGRCEMLSHPETCPAFSVPRKERRQKYRLTFGSNHDRAQLCRQPVGPA